MKWITRERPKTDRIACPWLISGVIDPHAEIIYVPANQVLEKAKEYDAICWKMVKRCTTPYTVGQNTGN